MNVTEYQITSGKLTRPYKIVLLCDLHDKPYRKLMKQVWDIDPDLILICGDVVDRHKKKYRRALSFLKACRNTAPTYFAPGNHEVRFPMLSMPFIQSLGITVLDNQFLKVNDLVLGGQIPYMTYDWQEDFFKEEGFKILMDHHPEHYAKRGYEHLPVDLVLSGHAHGGQWVLFGHAILSPGQGFFPKYTHGKYGKMIVSSGLANSVKPIPRINNPTEIVLLHLEPLPAPEETE